MVHPSWLHHVTVAPCMTQTPFFWACFFTPLEDASFLRCAMRDTNSTLSSLAGTSLKATSFLLHLSTMRFTHSSLHGFIGTTFMIASFHLPLSAMGDTNSSLNDYIGTSLKTASLNLRAVRDTNATPHDLIGTSLVAASLLCFLFCSVCDANSTLPSQQHSWYIPLQRSIASTPA